MRLTADGPTGPVPAHLFIPPGTLERPLLLIGHGGAASKDAPHFVRLCRRYATSVGLPVLIIDGPAHGERAPKTGSRDEDFRVVQRAQASHEVAHQFACDWQAAATRAQEMARVGEPGAYVGYSMGTMLGVGVVAAMTSIKAAVFGAGGVPQPGGLAALVREVEGEWAAKVTHEEHGDSERRWPLLDAAPHLQHCDVLMLNNTDDIVFPPARALQLFEQFPGSKKIVFWAGAHGHLPDEAFEMSFAHIRAVLGIEAVCAQEA